jgi:eukaryotic-like serine/threonine-protein kinase
MQDEVTASDPRSIEGCAAQSNAPRSDEAGLATVFVGPGGSAEDPHAAPLPGTHVARYVVLEEAGRGGMGRVLRAYDPKLQREVALKEVNHDALGEAGTRRLVAEARAMAKLSHPNVVAIHDVEEVDARVILVMEYVPGGSLRDWLQGEPRSWREIVDCFVAAGRGLAAAHAADVLHRDFKPANVLVAGSTVKVTDFGLAKHDAEAAAATGEGGAHAPIEVDLTASGFVLGTPRYMAPEQHAGRTLDATADQYAFCVALWEALCERPPFPNRELARHKADGPPPWPGLAHRLRATKRKLPREIPLALARGLSPDPARRWPGLHALLDALCVHEAAGRTSRVMWLGGVAVVGLAAAMWQPWAASREQPCSGSRAQLEGVWDSPRRDEVRTAIAGIGAAYAGAIGSRTETALDAYADAWAAARTEACAATTLRGEQSAEVMDLRMACLHGARQHLAAVTEVLASADAEVVLRAHQLVDRLPPLAACSDLEALRAEVPPPHADDAEAVDLAQSRLARARALYDAGRFADARTELDEVERALDGVGYGPIRTRVKIVQGALAYELGDRIAAEAALREASRLAAQHRQWRELLTALRELMGQLGERDDRVAEALQYSELALGLAADDPADEAAIRDTIGGLLCAQGKCEEGEKQQREALALRESVLDPYDDEIAQSHNNIGNARLMQLDFASAESEYRIALRIHEHTLGAEHPLVAQTRFHLGSALAGLERLQDAEHEQRVALDSLERSLGPDHILVTEARGNLGNTLAAMGRLAEAEVQSRKTLEAMQRTLPPDHMYIGMELANLGHRLHAQGKHEAARGVYRRAFQRLEELKGPLAMHREGARVTYALTLEALGEHEEAEALARRAVTTLHELAGPDDPQSVAANEALDTLLARRAGP